MKILIIGGTRFFGKRLVHLLIEKGHKVSVLSRGNQPDDFGDVIQRLKADRTDKSQLAKAVEGLTFDVVVDQICMTGQEVRDAIDIFKNKTSYYLLTSTLAVYETGANLSEVDFDPTKYQPVSKNDYASGKREAERELILQNHLPAAAARFPIVLGTDDYTERLLNQIKRVKQELPIHFPNLDARFTFITSEDAALSLLWLIENRHTGAFNFASQETIRLRDLVTLIENATGKKATLTEESSAETHSPFGIEKDWYVDVTKAQKLGLKAKDLSDWLPDLIKTLSL